MDNLQKHYLDVCKDQFRRLNTDGDPDVIEFISNINYHSGTLGAETIHDLFRAGYCYWFAHMLMSAFNRGHLCLTYPLGHIVWEDVDGKAYDIEGVYRLEDTECEMLIPVKFLGGIVFDFMHVPNKEYHAPEKLHEWATSMGWTDTFAVVKIFLDMPKDFINYETDNITDVVYRYWEENIV